ncbi:helix-turn-helix transcriptional regulator [Priestia megaterium]|uniref:helix-turn-helix domain-containing protein n=1 Tax=Priestia megaterium TaxID=1404 RepID=UPI001A940FE6|nr:helix-turn-helix transcriptional regulator [Priestia megaterium]MBU8589299.1 helix-turn-helix transcriptional regulator [Priestia megaterium]MCT9853316.1 helix-turn-helix transcriptional regulator [Priestia megaterium]MDF1964025.1 helix-turn-helix transcriptional regulator [Priestia megaterium]MDF2010577.1 helix-turn-helix transcriptional regulator [Priestia megaterium]MED4136059.1 helix-turn-helix transcriptional regulator [Priestia megaterium]
MWSTGKKRSKLGRFLDRKGYSQTELGKVSKLNKNTVSKICNDPNYTPSIVTIKKVMKALKKLDPKLKSEDFFDI